MLEAFGISDPGCVRENNEDFFLTDTDAGIFILADGMGGANAGEYASRFSAEMLYRLLLQSAPDGLDTLNRDFAEVNSAVREAARRDPALEGMGTTLLVARTVDPVAERVEVQIASVGDSRAYQYSGGALSLITRDQTWVAELGLSDQALRRHPMRHLLTMAVGAAQELQVNSEVVDVKAGDQILLCSDGLHGVVDEQFLREALNSEKSLEDKCHYLVEAAKQNGGPDNITVVLIQLN